MSKKGNVVVLFKRSHPEASVFILSFTKLPNTSWQIEIFYLFTSVTQGRCTEPLKTVHKRALKPIILEDLWSRPQETSLVFFIPCLVIDFSSLWKASPLYLESNMCRRSNAMLFPLDETHCVVFLSSNLPFCHLSFFITTYIISVLRMKFWKQLWWNMAKTSGLVLLPYCIGNQQSSAKPDGKWGTSWLGKWDS